MEGIRADNGGDDLNLIGIPFREERAEGTINQPADMNLFFCGLSFPLEKATRDLSRSIGLLEVVYRKRDERLGRFGGFRSYCGNKDKSIPKTNKDRTIRLFGDPAGLKGDFLPFPEELDSFLRMNHKTVRYFLKPRALMSSR
jgi:hypothetical protein